MTEPLPTGGEPCDTSKDASDYTAEAASSCGYTIYPLSQETTQSDGERDYDFIEDGETLTRILPPPNFDPLTATDEQLATYGYPEPPAQSATADYQSWVSQVESIDVPSAPIWDDASTSDSSSPPDTGVAGGALPDGVNGGTGTYDGRACLIHYKGQDYSVCWTGLIIKPKAKKARITGASMKYQEPKWAHGTEPKSGGGTQSCGYSGLGTTWVGVGPYQVKGSPLSFAQDGTYADPTKSGVSVFFGRSSRGAF